MGIPKRTMGNTQTVSKDVSQKYPYNSLPMAQDGKILCCFAIFPVRIHPSRIANLVLGLDLVGITGSIIWHFALLTKTLNALFGLLIVLPYFGLVLTLYLKWVKFLREDRLQKWWCCYYYFRQTCGWAWLLYSIAVAAWLLNDISEAYENREFAPPLAATEINRLHKGYVGTYWQEIASRSILLMANYSAIALSTWWIAVGCAAYTAMHKMMGDQRRIKAESISEPPVAIEESA